MDYRGGKRNNRCSGWGKAVWRWVDAVIGAFEKLLENGRIVFLSLPTWGPIAAIMKRLFPQENRNRYDWQPKSGMGYAILLDNNTALRYTDLSASKCQGMP
jgi:hypothetical protein